MSPLTTESEPLIPDAADTAPASRRRRWNSTPEWLLRVTVESALIVVSILLALGVDEWREIANNRDLARQSLQIFERELLQNLTQLDDNIPYHIGLRDVAMGMVEQPGRLVDVRSLVEGLTPVRLMNTAWETALATGALTRIDVETVSALSLTYSFQQRFRDETRAGLPRLVISDGMSGAQKLEQIRQAVSYLSMIVQSEQELRAVYIQALSMIKRMPADSIPVGGGDTVHPHR